MLIAFSIKACRKALAKMIILDELPFRFVIEVFKNFNNLKNLTFILIPNPSK